MIQGGQLRLWVVRWRRSSSHRDEVNASYFTEHRHGVDVVTGQLKTKEADGCEPATKRHRRQSEFERRLTIFNSWAVILSGHSYSPGVKYELTQMSTYHAG